MTDDPPRISDDVNHLAYLLQRDFHYPPKPRPWRVNWRVTPQWLEKMSNNKNDIADDRGETPG